MTPEQARIFEAAVLTCLESNPIDFRSCVEAEVRRARAAIERAATREGAIFRRPMTRNNFLCGCLDFTEHLPEEHLIVGYGYRHGSTTRLERVHRVAGEERRVDVPDYVDNEIRRHHSHRSDAEVIVFHNHPRTGEESSGLYAVKSLVDDLPIASHADRRQLERHGLNPVGLLRHTFGQGRVLFYLGESGFVKPFQLPAPSSVLEQLNRFSAGKRA